jgi:hypothetical protein
MDCFVASLLAMTGGHELPSLHALLRVAGREPAPDLIRGRGWGVYQLAPLAASLLSHPPPPTPPRRFAGGGG